MIQLQSKTLLPCNFLADNQLFPFIFQHRIAKLRCYKPPNGIWSSFSFNSFFINSHMLLFFHRLDVSWDFPLLAVVKWHPCLFVIALLSLNSLTQFANVEMTTITTTMTTTQHPAIIIIDGIIIMMMMVVRQLKLVQDWVLVNWFFPLWFSLSPLHRLSTAAWLFAVNHLLVM